MSDHNIYQRINEVRKAVEYVQKDTSVQSYKAVTHDNVTAVLRPHLVKHGIVIVVDQVKGKMLQYRGNDVKQHLYCGTYEINYINVDSPEDRIVDRMQAHAADSSDKAPGKCCSYATKVSMLKTFSLETGEDEEKRYSDPYTPEQFAVYHEFIEQGKAYEFYLFIATLPQETLNALYNSFPDGKKTQGKKQVKELEEQGRQALDETVDEIKARLANQDISVLELTDEMSVIEKRFLMSRLHESEVRQLAKIKEAAQ